MSLIPQPHGGALRPAWRRGDIPNPTGRPKAGASLAEWVNILAAKGPIGPDGVPEGLTDDELEEIANDPTAGRNKRSAAGRVLATRDPEKGGEEWDRVCDRTDGQAVKRTVQINGNLDQHNPAEIVQACKVLGVPQAKWPVRALEYARANGLLGDTANAGALPSPDPTADTPQTPSPRSVESETL